jgi:Tim10/DDP family zinc finger
MRTKNRRSRDVSLPNIFSVFDFLFVHEWNESLLLTRLLTAVHELTETCFKKCITGSISSGKLAGKEESCIQNCVERFMDSNLAVLKHLERLRAGQ